ncbi:MAG TPA: SMP-30/gluconolactonase/LRE family protein [Gemmataceae bacterium]|nr:SMP-30/gluconolactonase/LRE family protein [Pirellulales bacterium]HZZ78504.1 SMP-30/gluconolactonase/LRE family protein [Gemmataceae bacterium]
MFDQHQVLLKTLCASLAVASALLALGRCSTATAAEKVLLAEGLNNPESAVVGEDGRIYVTITGKPDSKDDGQVVVIEDGKATVIAEGMNDPRGIDHRGKELFVADKLKVWRIDENAQASVYVDTDAFPVKPRFLNDVEVGPDGDVYISDSGSFTGNGVIFRIGPKKEVTVVCDTKTAPAIKGPNGLLADGKDHLLLADVSTGKLFRVEIATGKVEEIAAGLGGGDGVARDTKGRIYVGDVRGGKVFRVDAVGSAPVLVADGFKSAADIALDAQGRILVPDSRAGTLTALVPSE